MTKLQKAIERIINQKGYRGSVIYGRRRLGKTELLKHCLLNRSITYIFYQCVQENEKENVARLTRQKKSSSYPICLLTVLLT
ncbi:MAG: hypothetical protein PUC86_08750 [Solobacterium sp.]|nr:hypothetical protein [Solobacterium sp.]